MLDHVSVTVSDPARSLPFWDAIMAALGVPCVRRDDDNAGYGVRNRPGDDGHSYLSVRTSTGTVVPDNRHWAFRAASPAAVRAIHAAALKHGGSDDGPQRLVQQGRGLAWVDAPRMSVLDGELETALDAGQRGHGSTSS